MITVAGNQVSLLHDGEQCLAAMLAAINAAKREILLEMYWFGSDTTGRRFAAALARKARQGLRVCITYDAIGSWEAAPDMYQDLAAAGCELYEFNPPGPLWRRFQLNLMQRRNHRKMLVIDGLVGMTGGVNLGDPWAPRSVGGSGFRDDMVRLQGPVVADMRRIFLRTFNQTRPDPIGDLRRRLRRSRPPRLVATNNSSRATTRATSRRLFTARARESTPGRFQHETGSGESIAILTNQGLRARRVIEQAYLEAIRSAKHSILIANSYFIPRRAIRKALAEAVARGVTVAILLPGVSDVPAAAFAARRLYARHMRAGIRIYEWQSSILHSKVAAIDQRWCTVGTHNLDYRSFFYNLEVNMVAESEPLATQLDQRIRQDMALAQAVDPVEWDYRPLANRFLEHLFYRFRRLL